MKVLVIKTSSMGDVLHCLPALTDAHRALPDIQFDWLIEEAFADIPAWHPAVNKVIPIAFRRLRKKGLLLIFNKEWRQFKRTLRQTQYDLVIDAQGLLKSAFLGRHAKGRKAGYNKQSIREPMASFFYHQKVAVSKDYHSIRRIRELFARCLNYSFDENTTDYGINSDSLPCSPLVAAENYLMFVINTTWDSKHYPADYWRELLEITASAKIPVVIPEGYAHEAEKVQTIAKGFEHVTLLSQVSLKELLSVIAHANGIISVDTGLSHLAAALAKPTVTLYGPTNPKKIGATGNYQVHLAVDFPCAPCENKQCTYQKLSPVTPACFTSLAPEKIWQTLENLLNSAHA